MAELTGEYFEVVARPDERWDLLAYDYLGDVKHQDLIINENFDKYLDPLAVPPLIIEAGTVIRIPVIEVNEVDDADLPPWKRLDPDYSNTEV